MAEAGVRASVRVPRRAEQVWGAVSDWPRQGEWMPGTRVWVTRGDGSGPGSRLAAFTGFADIGFLDTMEIVEWQPPLRCTVRHTGTLIRGTGGFLVHRRDANSSVFEWWERFRLPAAPAAVWPLIRPAAEWGLRRSLRAFARFCEDTTESGDG